MAVPFLNNITLNNNEIQNVRLQNGGNPPLSSGPGQIYFDTSAGDETAKYYSNVTDTWVSLKEYSFPAVIPANGYVTSAVTGSFPKPIITFDLNAVDGAAAVGERYLTKNNKWAEISTIPGTYNWNLSGETGGPTVILSGTGISIVGGQDLETTLSGTTLTVNLKVGPGAVGTSDNYVFNQSIAVADADDSIPFNSYTPGGNPPSTQVNVVKKTTLGTIPVNALTLVKQYIDDSVAGGLVYQGGYNAATNTPDLTTSPNSILKGWTYTVTADGTFFGEQLRVGDVLIAEVNDPSALGDWTTVQNNIDLASLTQVGIGNVNAEPAGNLAGIAVSYNAGTAKVGLGIAALGVDPLAETPADYFIPIYNAADDENKKVASSDLLTAINSVTSKTGTITAGNLSGTVAHTFGINTLVQTINSSGDTVYCDVTRTATTSVATIAVAEATDITILVQKIG